MHTYRQQGWGGNHTLHMYIYSINIHAHIHISLVRGSGEPSEITSKKSHRRRECMHVCDKTFISLIQA